MIRDPGIARIGLLLSNPADRRLAAEFLTHMGCEVPAMTDLSAVDELASMSIIIVDEAAGRHHGAALFRIKKQMHPLYIPLLLMLPGQTRSGPWLRAGFDDVLRLPLPKDEFQARLEVFLRLRKHSEQVQKENENRFNATFDMAPVGIVHTTPDGYFMRPNRKFCEILGYEENELKHRSFADVTHATDIRLSKQEQYALLSKPVGAVSSFEKRYLRKDGSSLWASVNVSLVHDHSGKPDHFIAVVEDITARKQMEASLRESERFANSTMDALSTHLCVVDETGTIIAVNQAWRDFASANGGSPNFVFKGVNYLSVCDVSRNDSALEAKAVAAGIREVLAGKRDTFSMEYPCHSATEKNWFLMRVTPFRGKGAVRAVIAHTNITERKRAEERLLQMAHYDALTALPNRVLFQDRLNQALAQADRHQWIVAVLFIDLDHFKLVNDTLGHRAGDSLLQQVSDRLARCLRSGDTIGRLGGDEFAIILSNLGRNEDAARVAQKLMTSLEEPIQIGGLETFVKASIGITVYPSDGTTPELLIQNADTAMYRAKELGRNNYQFYVPEMNARAQQKLTLGSNLQRALERDELFLHYQPQVDLKTRRIIGAEALIRWNHPSLGVVSPAEFIPVAEETGLIVPIGEWALRTACAHNKRMQDVGLPTIRVAVNLSPRQFTQNDVISLVQRALDETGLEGCYLELELTEGMMMDKAEDVIATLNKLKALGIHVSIDDFGTGYSNLGYLERFPLNTLKIDKSFVHRIGNGTGSDEGTIAKAVINLGHSLGFHVIAEGVETEEQLQFLREQGCDSMQGYYFSRPVSGDAFIKLLASHEVEVAAGT